MKYTLLFFVLSGSIIIFSCHRNSDGSSLKYHQKKISKSISNNWLGNWDRHEWQNGGGLTISKIDRDSFTFHLEVVGGGATGELNGRAYIAGDSAVFTSNENELHCRMVFRFDKNRSAIEISSNGCDDYAGLNAYFEGTYVRTNGKTDSWDDADTQTLVKLHILNKNEDDVLRKLVGNYYRTYIVNTQITEDDLPDKDKLNTKVIASSVNQMRTYMEYIIMIDSARHVWTAVIDDDKVRYFTNSDLFRDHLPKTIEEWRERFKEDSVVYHNK